MAPPPTVTVPNGGIPPAPGNGVQLITPAYPTDDLVVATVVATKPPYNADASGNMEAAPAIQKALDDCHQLGGGVVWLPVGRYKLSSGLTVPPHCTLRGEWRDPDTGSGAYGAVLMATVPSGGELETPLVGISGNAGVNGLTVYYPVQSASNPTPYPFTFAALGTHLSGDGAELSTVENVTLLDSYLGISAGEWTGHALHTFRHVRGTVLMTGVYVQDSSDTSRNEDMVFNASYWAHLDGSVAHTHPTQAQIAAWTRTHATGMRMGGLDGDVFLNLTFSDVAVGIDLIHGRRDQDTSGLIGITVTNSHIALRVVGPYLAPFGLNIANSTFQANQGANPIALQVTGDNPATSVLFNHVTFAGGGGTAAQLHGDLYVAFIDCTFEQWGSPYAIVADHGTLAVEGSRFTGPLTAGHRGIQLLPGLSSATILGSVYSGDAAYLLDDSSGSGIQPAPVRVIRQDTGFPFVANTVPGYTLHALPRPSTTHFYNVRAAPYHASANGVDDDTTAIQKALDAAGKAGGGTVYVPAGLYAIKGHLVVPAGVELRGSDDIPHRATILSGASGTILYAYEGKSTATPDADAPFILLNGDHAGVRGLGVHYPEQATDSSDHLVAYPWTIQGKGTGVYAFDVALTNAYQGLDFATYPTNGHYLAAINGLAFRTGIRVGNATEGWIEDAHFNTSAWGDAFSLANVPPVPNDLGKVALGYTLVHERAFVVTSGAQHEHLINDFVYGAQTGFLYEDDAQAQALNTFADGGPTTVLVTGTGPGGVTLLNLQGCGCVNPGAVVRVQGGRVTIFNLLTLRPNDATGVEGIHAEGGTYTIEGGAVDQWYATFSGGLGLVAGTFFKAPFLEITISGLQCHVRLWGNVGQGGFTPHYTNGAPALDAGNIPR
jgi:hypothetical protein